MILYSVLTIDLIYRHQYGHDHWFVICRGVRLIELSDRYTPALEVTPYSALPEDVTGSAQFLPGDLAHEGFLMTCLFSAHMVSISVSSLSDG